MNRILKGVALSAVAAAALAMPVQSQTGRWAVKVHGGMMNPGDLGTETGTNLEMREKAALGAGLDVWLGESRRWGITTQGTWGRTWFEAPGVTTFNKQVRVMAADAALSLRLRTPTNGTRFLPYISVGSGVWMINADDDPNDPYPAAACSNGGGQVCDFEAARLTLDVMHHVEWAATAAIGTDFFVTPSVALRLEAKDLYTTEGAFRELTTGEFTDGGNNFLCTGGLAFYMGRARVEEPGFVREEPIIVTPPPAPRAPTPVAVTPAPPAEETVTMCIVDPSNLQARTVSATRVISENRVYVMQNGQRVLFENAYPASSPIYVRGATWYMNDQPLVVDLEPITSKVTGADRNRLELVLFGSPMQRTANDLLFMGTINGTPVYATSTDVVALQPRLRTHFSTTTDLTTILRSDADLARDLGSVSTYYVAVEPNCVFQPVSVTHFVRRTRG